MSNGGLVLGEHDDFPVDEAGDIVAKGHIHHLFETQQFEFRRFVEASAVERVVERKKVRFRVFIFAEKTTKTESLYRRLYFVIKHP